MIMIIWLYVLVSFFAFFLKILHICEYSIRCLLSPFSTISSRFVIRACVGDDILDVIGLLLACVRVSMSFISCSASYRCLNSIWKSRHQHCASSVSYVQSDVAHNHFVAIFNVDLVDDCYVCDVVWPVCYDAINLGLRYTGWAFSYPSLSNFLLKHGIHDFDFLVLPILPRCRLFRFISSPNVPVVVSIGFVIFPTGAMKSRPHRCTSCLCLLLCMTLSVYGLVLPSLFCTLLYTEQVFYCGVDAVYPH